MAQHLAARLIRFVRRVIAPTALIVLLLVAMYLAADAEGLGARYARFYPWVFVGAALALALLAIAILQRLWRLRTQLRRGVPGARLTRRLLLLLVLLSLPPLLLVYGFGVRFINVTVDSWFPANSAEALRDALGLGQRYLDDRIELARERTATIAAALAATDGDSDAADLGDTDLEQALDRSDALQLSLFGKDGRVRALAAAEPALLQPSPPDDELRLELESRGSFAGAESMGDGMRIRVLQRLDDETALQALFRVPEGYAAQALRVESAIYAQERAVFLRDSLKLAFTLILTFVLLLSLLAAVLLAFGLARRLVAPIGRLAIATRHVAEGRYDAHLPEAQDDELGFLVQSFNRMTRELDLAGARARSSAEETERQRAFLETVLAHLSSGVLVVDGELQLRSANAAARELLGLDPGRPLGLPLAELRRLLPHAAGLIDPLLQRLREGSREWREEVAFDLDGERRVLLLRGARLPDAGAVAVFDDTTVIDRARRDAAWAEVARRLAHEIKNPLTPIQLAAERLRRRVLPKLEADDADVVDRATHTIVAQVDALKTMVNGFGDYARPPTLQLAPLDVNALAREVLDLYEHDARLHLLRELDPVLPRVTADQGRVRQVLHNLVKNAIEASASRTIASIAIATRTLDENGRRFVELAVSDDGPGLPEGFDAGWFEPYRSTKARGSGLGLAIVAKIAQEHGGRLDAVNRPEGGARFTLRLPL